MSTLALFDDTIDAFVMSIVPPQPKPPMVSGWVKTFQDTGDHPLPTLNFVKGDGNEYHEATFGLRFGATIGVYELSRHRGVRVPGEKDLISLYDACRRGLAWETTETTLETTDAPK